MPSRTGADAMRDHRLVLVLAAGGGAGASLLAGAIALAWARSGRPTRLIELDLERGDLAGAWELPSERTLDDLVPVAGELAGVHLRQAVHVHASGLELLLGPGRIGATRGWDRSASARLLDAAREGHSCVVDAGPIHGAAVAAAAARATDVLIAAPPTLSAARRTLRLAEGLATIAAAPEPRLVVNLGRDPRELGPKTVSLAVGLGLAATLPRSDREAAEFARGRWPTGRGRALANVVVGLARSLG